MAIDEHEHNKAGEAMMTNDDNLMTRRLGRGNVWFDNDLMKRRAEESRNVCQQLRITAHGLIFLIFFIYIKDNFKN